MARAGRAVHDLQHTVPPGPLWRCKRDGTHARVLAAGSFMTAESLKVSERVSETYSAVSAGEDAGEHHVACP